MDEQSEEERERIKALRRWVKTEVSDPVPWGEVEQRLTSEPVPPRADLEAMFPKTHPASYLALLFLVPKLVLISGAPIGFGFVVAYVFFDAAPPPEWNFVVRLCFIDALLVLVIPLLNWWDSKRRDGFGVMVAAVSVALLTPSWLLMISEPDISPGTKNVAAAGALVALVELILFTAFARPAIAMTRAERRSRPTPEDRYHQGLRSIVLHEFVQKGLVHRDDVHDLVHMPRGTWHEVVTDADGRVERRTALARND